MTYREYCTGVKYSWNSYWLFIGILSLLELLLFFLIRYIPLYYEIKIAIVYLLQIRFENKGFSFYEQVIRKLVISHYSSIDKVAEEASSRFNKVQDLIFSFVSKVLPKKDEKNKEMKPEKAKPKKEEPKKESPPVKPLEEKPAPAKVKVELIIESQIKEDKPAELQQSEVKPVEEEKPAEEEKPIEEINLTGVAAVHRSSISQFKKLLAEQSKNAEHDELHIVEDLPDGGIKYTDEIRDKVTTDTHILAEEDTSVTAATAIAAVAISDEPDA